MGRGEGRLSPGCPSWRLHQPALGPAPQRMRKGAARWTSRSFLAPATPPNGPPVLAFPPSFPPSVSIGLNPLVSTAAAPLAQPLVAAANPTVSKPHVPSRFFSTLLHTGFAGPGISGKINSGGEKLTWFLGVFVFWQAVRARVERSWVPHQTNEEKPAMGAREPGARLLGGR